MRTATAAFAGELIDWHNALMHSSPRLRWTCGFLWALLFCAAHPVSARDDSAETVRAVQDFIAQETRQHGPDVRITVQSPASILPPCSQRDVFFPAETRPWGKISVGVKCHQPSPWTIYLPVRVQVFGTYLISAKKINRGQVMTAGDLEQIRGDLTALPPSILTDLALTVGQRTKVSIAPKQPILREHIALAPIIKQGDKIKLVVHSAGFSVSTEGIALHHAAEGEPVKVRNGQGKTLTGIARLNGQVELKP